MAELKLLVNSRKYTRKLVTEIYNQANTFPTLSFVQREELKTRLSDYISSLKQYNAEIAKLKWAEEESEKNLESELESCEEYNKKISHCLSLLSAPCASSSPAYSNAAGGTLLKCPVVPLPKFTSAEGEDLSRFFTEFEETVAKFGLPDYDKLVLLKQQISGRALVLVNSLEADKQGYFHAKKLLEEALASKDLQISNTIKSISQMKMNLNSDPFDYISKMRLLTESVNKLNIDQNNFLEYFFWDGLPDEFKQQLTSITNKNRPSLKDMNDNFFVASERFTRSLKLKSGSKVSTKSSFKEEDSLSMAAAVNLKENR